MIVQILSSKSRWIQFTMGNIILVIFIVYYLDLIFPINSVIIYTLMTILGLIVLYFFRNLMSLRRQVKPYGIWKANKLKDTGINFGGMLLEMVLSGGLIVFHFWLFRSAGKELMPLVWDYGFAGIAFLGIRFFMDRNFYIGVAEEGIILGSKFEPKVIDWTHIKGAKYETNKVVLIFQSDFPISKLVLQPENQVAQIKQLLEMKGVGSLHS